MDRKKDFYVVELIAISICLVVFYYIMKGFKYADLCYIGFYTGMIVCLFWLELRYSNTIEKGDHSKLRIQSHAFTKNPTKELERYLEDTVYYNNTWRISALCACIICLLFTLRKTIPLFPLIFIIIFSVIYQCWNWKLHHTYNFIFKSTRNALKHLSSEKRLTKPFIQEQMVSFKPN